MDWVRMVVMYVMKSGQILDTFFKNRDGLDVEYKTKRAVKTCSKLEFALRLWKDGGASAEMGKAGDDSHGEIPISHQRHGCHEAGLNQQGTLQQERRTEDQASVLASH